MRLALVFGFIFNSCFAVQEPPRDIPKEFYEGFTMGGKIPVVNYYIDDTYSDSMPIFYSKSSIDLNIEKVRKKEMSYYGHTDIWLYQALEKYPIVGKEVAIVGSNMPWYESIVLAYGGIPTTIEYNKIVTDDPRLKILTVHEYEKNPKKFDVVISISSVEHDGLGRYGDPVNPNGDLEFMAKAKRQMVKNDGHLILAVPVGPDALYWNAHRIYGPIRFPKLCNEWKILDSFGFKVEDFTGAFGNSGHQPIFYLAPQ